MRIHLVFYPDHSKTAALSLNIVFQQAKLGSLSASRGYPPIRGDSRALLFNA
jgi:hypothetical protein